MTSLKWALHFTSYRHRRERRVQQISSWRTRYLLATTSVSRECQAKTAYYFRPTVKQLFPHSFNKYVTWGSGCASEFIAQHPSQQQVSTKTAITMRFCNFSSRTRETSDDFEHVNRHKLRTHAKKCWKLTWLLVSSIFFLHPNICVLHHAQNTFEIKFYKW